jgi:uroporphyrinogen decarboxylase
MMNARERILAVLHHQSVDRIPTDIWATGEVWNKLRAHFGPDVDIRKELRIDGIASARPEYVGPALPATEAGESIDHWGIRYKAVDYGSGSYMEQSHAPLADARTIDDIERYAWPRAEWFNFAKMPDQAQQARQQQVVMAGYMAPLYYHTLLRGMENAMMDPLEQPEFTHCLLDRLCESFHEHHLRMFQTCEGLIDLSQVTDDLGSQTGPLISMGIFREFYKPHMKRFIDLCHAHDIAVFHHDDGSCRAFLPELVEMGIDILNPIQHNCPGMGMRELKGEFGSRTCFHGGVDNQHILPFGTPEQVRQEVRDCIDALASDGTGYILAPCHNLQAVSPVENIIAMYDEAWEYGRRS